MTDNFKPKGKDPEAEHDAYHVGYQKGWDDARRAIAPCEHVWGTRPRDGQSTLTDAEAVCTKCGQKG